MDAWAPGGIRFVLPDDCPHDWRGIAAPEEKITHEMGEGLPSDHSK